MNTISKRGGFTLIELLVVIAIIGILSSVVLASLNSARQKGRDASRIQSVKQIQNALQLYWNTNGYFPAGNESALVDALTPIYINSIPTDPLGGTNAYQYQALTSPTAGGVCNSGSNCQSYHLSAKLEQGANAGVFIGDRDGEDVAGSTSGTSFDGLSTSANCGSSASGPAADLCYDVTP